MSFKFGTDSLNSLNVYFRAAARVGKGAIIGFTLEKDGRLVCGASLEEAIKTVDKATKHQVSSLVQPLLKCIQ